MKDSSFNLILVIIITVSSNSLANHVPDSNAINNAPKHELSIEVGAQKSMIGKPVYIEGPELPCECEYRMWGYGAGSTTGIQFNILYDFRFAKKIGVRSGISIYSRPEVFTSDSSTLSQIKAQYNLVSLDQNEVERRISSVNIEVPLSIGFESGKIRWYVGLHFVIARYITRRSSYVDGLTTSDSFLSWISPSTSTSSYFDTRLYYNISTPKLNFGLFTGLSFSNINFWEYMGEYNYVQFGINIPITNQTKL